MFFGYIACSVRVAQASSKNAHANLAGPSAMKWLCVICVFGYLKYVAPLRSTKQTKQEQTRPEAALLQPCTLSTCCPIAPNILAAVCCQQAPRHTTCNCGSPPAARSSSAAPPRVPASGWPTVCMQRSPWALTWAAARLSPSAPWRASRNGRGPLASGGSVSLLVVALTFAGVVVTQR